MNSQRSRVGEWLVMLLAVAVLARVVGELLAPYVPMLLVIVVGLLLWSWWRNRQMW